MELLCFESGRQITVPYRTPNALLETFTFRQNIVNRVAADIWGAMRAQADRRRGGSPLNRLLEERILRPVTTQHAEKLEDGRAEPSVRDGVQRVAVPEPRLPDHLVPPAAREMEDRIRANEPKSIEVEAPAVKPPPRARA